MKKALKFSLLVLISLLAAARTDAQERFGGPQGFRGGPGGPGELLRASPLMQTLDADKDNEISAQEIENSVAALKTLDKNKDGKLTEDELRPNFPEGGRGFGGRGPGGLGGRGGDAPPPPDRND